MSCDQLQSYTCGKCDGKGRIDAFSYYANGVCFWCQGAGKIKQRKNATYKPSQLDEKRINWLASVSASRFSIIPIDKMVEIDDWVHQHPKTLIPSRYWNEL